MQPTARPLRLRPRVLNVQRPFVGNVSLNKHGGAFYMNQRDLARGAQTLMAEMQKAVEAMADQPIASSNLLRHTNG